MSGVNRSPVATAHMMSAAPIAASDRAKTIQPTRAGLIAGPTSPCGTVRAPSAPAGDPARRSRERVAHGPKRDAVADVGRLAPLAALVDAHDLRNHGWVRGAHRPAHVA